MNKVICKLAFRESGIFAVPVIILLIGLVLFQQEPLRYANVPAAVLGMLLGILLAWRTFSDYGNVRAFLFSRSFSPKRFFFVRWLFGLGTIIVTGIVLAAIIAFGLRQFVQQVFFASGWYPMIRFEELHVLTPYILASLFSYHSTLYFMLVNRFRPPVRRRGFFLCLRWVETLLLILLAAVLICSLGFAGIILAFSSPSPPYFLFVEYFLYIIFGIPILLQLFLAPCLGIYCYRNQEIES
ncbi:MAG: hypothetical protein LBT46_05170 [Planctomycetaceae bacterium]|jgi:hypothetical protein|nr:hypothetical protein [Planctomycetaceae bacterium]